jgi:tyrosine-protein phosphatase SIW14
VKKKKKKLLLMLNLAALLLAGCTSTTFYSHDIPNLRSVRPGVYRSGTPISTNGWNFIRYSLGVTNAIKLSLMSEGSAAYAESIGIKVHYYPINMAQQAYFKPSFNLVSNAVYSITTNTLVFCLHGQDRTGLIVASERVWIEHWSKQAAWMEAEDCGFHDELHGLSDFFEDEVQ